MDTTNLILLILLALGIFGGNPSVSIAVTVLLFLRLTHLNPAFPYLEQYGLTVGVTVLTIGVLAPVASGKIGLEAILQTFTHWHSLLAVGVGILVAYLGGRGVNLMAANPLIVTSILVGTIIGVAVLRGVPVGPLIAAGMVSLLLGAWPK